MNRTSIIFALLVIWFFSPLMFMVFNLGGFAELNTDLLNDIVDEQGEINILTLQGFSAFAVFLLNLAGFTAFSNVALVVVFYGFLSALSLVIGVWVLRGGGS